MPISGRARATMRRCGLLAWALVALTARTASAQILPEAPLSLIDGHLVVGGEASATVAPQDPGFFNYTSYEFSALRNVRLGVSAEIRANARVQVLGELRFDQGRVLEAYGLFVRVRPFAARQFDLQAGRIPPTFGSMSRTAYGTGNMLIGQPLAYQYLTSIRPDALPATTDDLLRMRGRGWLSNFPIGNTAPAPGLPIVNTSRWDTGVQAHGVTGMVEWTGSITAGSPSDPRFRDNNGGRQVAGRAVVRPLAAIAIGGSIARGAWLDRSLEESVIGTSPQPRAQQVAIGGDLEYSAGPFLVRGEVIRSTWSLPAFGSLQLAEPLRALSSLIEGRYKIAPGWYVAARGDRLDFSKVRAPRGLVEWYAQTWRFETGLGYSISRTVMAKGVWQKNGRDGGRVRNDSFIAGQVMYWF
jgi:hypothetical protein